MKSRSQGGWQLPGQGIQFNLEGKAPTSSPVDPVPRPPCCAGLGESRALGAAPPAPHLPPCTAHLQPPSPLHDPACVTSKSTQPPKGSPLPSACPPPGSTLNPADTMELCRTGLCAQRCSSATDQAWKPENPSLIKRLQLQKLQESRCFRRHRILA